MRDVNISLIAPNLHKCEIWSPPQLSRVVGGRRDQQGGVGAELAAQRVSEGGEIFESSISLYWILIGQIKGQILY